MQALETPITDIQMRVVAELEERYWDTHFSTQTHYVAGRGYDQYQPAYKLGWRGALQHPDASFEDFASVLEVQWLSQRATSLLPWREVHGATREAWVHAQAQMHTLNAPRTMVMSKREVAHLLRPLYRNCVLVTAALQRLGEMGTSDLVQQITDRHVCLTQNIAQGLLALGGEDTAATAWVHPWVSKMQAKWSSFTGRFTETDPQEFLALCEQKELHLLEAYQAVLSQPLPKDTYEALQQQAKQLHIHAHKLRWVRKNWGNLAQFAPCVPTSQKAS